MKLKIRNVLIGVGIYGYAFLTLFAINGTLLVIGIVWTALCMWITGLLIAGAERRRVSGTLEFSRTGAVNALGSEWGSFHHVFVSKQAVVESYRSALANALKGRLDSRALEELTFVDVDRELDKPEARLFFHTTTKETSRDTEISFLLTTTRTGDLQGVRWWILLKGVRDPNKVLWRYLLAPLVLPFTLWPYFRRDYDPLNGLTTVAAGFFNAVDILNRTRELQFVAFETLVEVLEAFGVDTSDLKFQKGNILNINVTGGQTNFGSVVQGAMNRVVGAVGAAQAGGKA